ncbi:MAG: sensor histidine kinase N-terminal domain-containing protein, partial [Rhizobacter sp.]
MAAWKAWFTPGTRSLHRHLLLWLLLPQLVLWMAAASFTYKLAERYANQAIDASLSTASRALARQVKPSGSGLYIDFPRAAQDVIEADPDDRLYYKVSSPPGEFILGNSQMPRPGIDDPQLNQPYLYDGVIHDRNNDKTTELPRDVNVRVAALYLAYGEPGKPQQLLVQVAKSRASRE